MRIGSPVTGYGQESRNRAARQRIPNRTWTDEDGVEHVEVNFFGNFWFQVEVVFIFHLMNSITVKSFIYPISN